MRARRRRCARATLLISVAMLLANIGPVVGPGSAKADDCQDTPEGRACHVQQPITSNTTVDSQLQRSLGLVTVNGGCSGTLLNQYWVLTARHCVTTDHEINGPLAPDNSVHVTADWSPGHDGNSLRIHEFSINQGLIKAKGLPHDIVLVLLDARANLGSVNSQGLHVTVDSRPDGSFGIVGESTSDTVVQYGRGFSTFATGTFGTPTAQPASGDGVYRSGRFRPSNIDEFGYRLDLNGTQVGHGGDSGGPTVVLDSNGIGIGIAGVQSGCHPTAMIDGYPPAAPFDWQWVKGIDWCEYVSVGPFADEILKTVREVPISIWDLPKSGLCRFCGSQPPRG